MLLENKHTTWIDVSSFVASSSTSSYASSSTWSHKSEKTGSETSEPPWRRECEIYGLEKPS
ncbi:hypothetical protein MTR_5g016690 [Medicago truncatula]|uniref:Uncharacterized protein n=1 Tax=Medicago truncatula TaxID=3880 RepID=G7K5A4_MEDTR|nr:hypothetical protein MTR_5g016690 [Medicago truncatula]